MIINIAHPKRWLAQACATTAFISLGIMFLNVCLGLEILTPLTTSTPAATVSETNPFSDRKATTLQSYFDIQSWSMNYRVSVYIPESNKLMPTAWVKIELPPEYTMNVNESWSCGLKQKQLSPHVWQIEKPNLGPHKPLKSGNRLLRFTCSGAAPNQGHSFRLSEIKLPKIIESNFDVKPFECKHLSTYNGGITWGELADE